MQRRPFSCVPPDSPPPTRQHALPSCPGETGTCFGKGRSIRRPGPQPSGALKVASSTGTQAGTQGGSFKRGDTRSSLDLHKTMFKPAFPNVVLPISQYACH